MSDIVTLGELKYTELFRFVENDVVQEEMFEKKDYSPPRNQDFIVSALDGRMLWVDTSALVVRCGFNKPPEPETPPEPYDVYDRY